MSLFLSISILTVLGSAQFIPAPYIEGVFSNSTGVNLNILTKSGARNATSDLLRGIMWEDISHSGDGGLYGELLVNRAFQGSGVTLGAIPGIPGDSIIASENPIQPFGPVLTGWSGVGNVRLTLDYLHPLSDNLQVVLQVDVLSGATGEVGIKNSGWWGIGVQPETYNASFYMLPNEPRYLNKLTHIDVSLRSNEAGTTFSSTSIPTGPNISTFEYQQYAGLIENTQQAPDGNNSFFLTMDASEVAGQTFFFDLVSLFGETYKGRQNGLRKDLAQNLADLKPKFLRFPGGNNLEGFSTFRRWKWWQTVGPLTSRPGRPGDWNYFNTDGLGLLEYLEWCEDMDIAPVLGVYSGYSLDIATIVDANEWPASRMQEVLQEALDELEFCMGSVDTPWGAKRAEYGHPEPFEITHVELGNEDWFSDNYPVRVQPLYTGLKAAYPDIIYIFSAYNENGDYTIDIPDGNMWDTHHYEEPRFFIESFGFWDNWETANHFNNVTIFVGEYSVYGIDEPLRSPFDARTAPYHVAYPRILSAIAEGVYTIGIERNPNTVKMAAYAPTLGNWNYLNWTPNDLQFSADPRETVLSVSYYQQMMFGTWHGTHTIPVTVSSGQLNPLFWVASIDDPTNQIYFKIINAGNTTQTLGLSFDAPFSRVNGTILQPPTAGDLNAFNYRNNATAVMPKPLSFTTSLGLYASNSTRFNWVVPAYSITVLQFQV